MTSGNMEVPSQNALEQQENHDITAPSNMSDLLKSSLQPIAHDELNQLLKEITDAYDRAQTWTKKYEITFNEVPIACINQMRNAGYHMCRFINDSKLTQSQPEINIDELRSIYKHLVRAYYDVLDEFTKRINELLTQTESNYKDLLLNPVDYFSEFYAWKDTVNELEAFKIFNDTQHIDSIAFNKTKRELHYENITQHVDKLVFINKQIQHMSDTLIIEANKIAKEDKRYWWQETRTWLSFVGGCILGAIALATFLYGDSVLKQAPENTSTQNGKSHKQ